MNKLYSFLLAIIFAMSFFVTLALVDDQATQPLMTICDSQHACTGVATGVSRDH